jgi:hypothetical protein
MIDGVLVENYFQGLVLVVFLKLAEFCVADRVTLIKNKSYL